MNFERLGVALLLLIGCASPHSGATDDGPSAPPSPPDEQAPALPAAAPSFDHAPSRNVPATTTPSSSPAPSSSPSPSSSPTPSPSPSPSSSPAPSPDPLKIPPALLGTTTLHGTCEYTYRGWTLDRSDECVAVNAAGPIQGDFTLRLAESAGVVAITGDPDGTNPNASLAYSLTVSAATPTAEYDNHAHPVYGKHVIHSYALQPNLLTVHAVDVHDNSSPYPIPQCWEYRYESHDCWYQLTW
jgi:hypothetical protein